MSPKEKAAELLYKHGWTRQRISKLLDVTTKTISTWKKKGDWDGKMNEYIFHKDQSEASIWKIIHFQSKAISKMTEIQLKKLEDETEAENISKMLINNSQLDGLKKLVSSITTKELRASDYLKFVSELCTWASEEDIDMAKKLVEICDQFVKTKITLMNE